MAAPSVSVTHDAGDIMQRRPSRSKLELHGVDVEPIQDIVAGRGAGMGNQSEAIDDAEIPMQRMPSRSKLEVPGLTADRADDDYRDLLRVDVEEICDDLVVGPTVVCLKFCLASAETQPGEAIRVVGSNTALGSWVPDQGILLTTTPETYPQWEGTVSLESTQTSPNPSAVTRRSLTDEGVMCVACVAAFQEEYKYVRDSRSIGGGFTWENGPNHVVSFPFAKTGTEWLVQDPCFGELGVGVPERANNSAGARAAFESFFEVIGDSPIESGTFGAVWRCQSRGEKGAAMKAAKRIDKVKLEERDFKNLFGCSNREGEIAIHRRVQHPHIVQLLDFFDDRCVVSLVLELCHGGDLFTCINRRRMNIGVGLPETTVVRVARHLFAALRFVHNRRIAHRDVKCENVLLVQDGIDLEQTDYKLCDFGFATCIPADGKLFTLLGSPQTVAPEVLQRKPYSLPSDMWSAGVLLYIAIAGREPFYAKTVQLVVKNVIQGTYSFNGVAWEQTSTPAKDLVSGLMEIDQARRCTVFAASKHPWLRAASEY